MSKIILQKEYTRDYSLMIEEMWDRALNGVFENNNPHIVKNIYYINDGVMEVWENKEAVKWYKEQLFKKNQVDKDFFNLKMDEYEVLLGDLEKMWINNYAGSLIELKKFIKLATLAMNYFLVFYYSAMDDRNNKYILDRARIIRNKDNFFDSVDNFIRKSVAYIYPDSGKFANTLIASDLDDMPSQNDLKQRFQNYVVDMGRNREAISLRQFANKNKNYDFIFDKSNNITRNIKGQVAFKGQARGIVKILKRKDQINDFKEGNILLSPMTTPDFVPAMKRAAAIVTDEGGIVCHAAILARELKIPCVIGTKIATKVFKDGDRVEVDAERGVVRKIN